MKTVSEDINKVSNLLFNDDVVSRGNILVRDASIIGEKGYYIRIIGTEEQCRRALELTKDVAKVVTGEEKERFLEKLKEEGEAAAAGFGKIFG